MAENKEITEKDADYEAFREGLLYAKSHEWVKEEGDVVTIGLTDYAQSELGDLVFVNLPEEGDSVSVGEAFGDVESVTEKMQTGEEFFVHLVMLELILIQSRLILV